MARIVIYLMASSSRDSRIAIMPSLSDTSECMMRKECYVCASFPFFVCSYSSAVLARESIRTVCVGLPMFATRMLISHHISYPCP